MPVLNRLPQAPDAASAHLSGTERSNVSSRICGAKGCSNGWVTPWKSRRRPVFEGEWSCCSRCMEQQIAAAVRRAAGEAPRSLGTDVHQHRVPLGLILLAQGFITHPQLQAALALQRTAGKGKVGEWLAQSCGLPEERVAHGLGVQWNCPVLSLDFFSPKQMALLMPKRFVAEFGMLPLRLSGSRMLYAGFEDTMNAAMAMSLEQMCGLRVESGLLPSTQYASARQRLLAAESVTVTVKTVKDEDQLTTSICKVMQQNQPFGSRLVRVQQYYWLRLLLEGFQHNGDTLMPQRSQDFEDYIFTIG